MLERDESRGIRVGMRLWELATRSSGALRLRQVALPFMERIQARVGEHTQLAILEQDEALFLERLSHPDAVTNITRVAGRLPLNASSSGLVLLAYADPEVREKLKLQYMDVVADTPAEARAWLAADIERWRPIIQKNNITLD